MLLRQAESILRSAILFAATGAVLFATIFGISHSHSNASFMTAQASIQNSQAWKGTVKTPVLNAADELCKRLMSNLVKLQGEVLRYDFVVEDDVSNTATHMVACVEVSLDGTQSYEYFPQSLFEPDRALR